MNLEDNVKYYYIITIIKYYTFRHNRHIGVCDLASSGAKMLVTQ